MVQSAIRCLKLTRRTSYSRLQQTHHNSNRNRSSKLTGTPISRLVLLYSLSGIGRYPGVPFDARPTVVGHANRFRGLEGVGHDLDALRGVESDVGDDDITGHRRHGQPEGVPEALGLKLSPREKQAG